MGNSRVVGKIILFGAVRSRCHYDEKGIYVALRFILATAAFSRTDNVQYPWEYPHSDSRYENRRGHIGQFVLLVLRQSRQAY